MYPNDLREDIIRMRSAITSMMTLVEDEVHMLHANRTESLLDSKKTVIEMLNRLFNMMAQLNKLANNYVIRDPITIEKDKKIIEYFLDKYVRGETKIKRIPSNEPVGPV